MQPTRKWPTGSMLPLWQCQWALQQNSAHGNFNMHSQATKLFSTQIPQNLSKIQKKQGKFAQAFMLAYINCMS